MDRKFAGVTSSLVALIAMMSCSDSSAGPAGLSTDDLSSDANRVVASIQVTLASNPIKVGEATQATASLKDARGKAIDRAVQWSSSNTAVATVTDSGVVRGLAAGSANIIARHRTVSGSASLNVAASDSVTPPPPPPPGTLLFQENFENASLGSRGWYDNTTVQISTTEHIAGSTASAQYHFARGAAGPTGGSTQRHKFTPTNSVYLSYYVKYSTNWVGSGQTYHPHEFYILSTLDGDYDGPSDNWMTVYVEHNYQNGGKPVISMQDNKSINYSKGSLPNNLVTTTEMRSTGGCNGMAENNMYSECFASGNSWYNLKSAVGPVVFQPNPGAGYKNNWNLVEAYVQLNTVVNGIGQKNGVIQYWFNGTQVIDRHDVLFRTGQHPNLQLDQLIIAPYIGDGSPVDQSMWIDNLRIATGRIP